MAASVQCRLQERTLGMVMKEVDEDLAMFLQMRRGVKDNEDHLHSEIFDHFNDSFFENSPADGTVGEDFLSSENDRSNCGWLLSLPSETCHDEEENSAVDVIGKHSDSTELDSTPADSPKGQGSQNNSSVELSTSSGKSTCSNSMNSCSSGNGRPLSSSSSVGRKPISSRSATPTGRTRLPSISKISRPSTPTSRATLPSAKNTTTTSRTNSRSSAPVARPSIPTTSKSASRSATPTRRTSTSSTSNTSALSAKTAPTTLKKARGTSPTVKSRPSSSSRDAPTNSQSSAPKRPVSASRGRSSAPYIRPSTTKTSSDGKPRHRSCSPPRRQITPNTSVHSHWNTSSLSRSRGYSNDEGDVNPVLMGTKMVERVVNMRKLAPPKPDDSTKKPSVSQKSSSFGTSFSKKSLDMAIRHMDIRRSSSVGNVNRAMKSISQASAVNDVGSKSKIGGVSLATSNASLEQSIDNGSHCCNESEVEDNKSGSEREQPAILQPAEE